MNRRLLRVMSAMAIVIAGTMPMSGAPQAAQASWYTAGPSSCPWPTTGYVAFLRYATNVPNPVTNGKCNYASTQSADSNLRTSGADVHYDGYFIGSNINNFPNTHQIRNKWTITINICSGVNYFVTRHVIGTGDFVNTYTSLSEKRALLSHRGSVCINN